MFERAIDTAVSRSSRVLRLLGIVVACCGAQSAGGPPTLPRSRASANASSKPRNRTIPDAGATTADSSTSPAADERASSAMGASHAERDLCAPITAQIEAKLREAETALRRGARRRNAAEARSAWAEVTAPMRTCLPAGSGGWIFEPFDPRFEWVRGRDLFGQLVDSYDIDVSGAWVFVDAQGVAHEGERVDVAWSGIGSFARQTRGISVFDYDSDGAGELIVELTSSGHESWDGRMELWTFSNGSVRPYAAADGIDLDSVVDFDHDGRLDIVSIDRYWSTAPCGMDPPPRGRPPVLFHSLPDGRFSASDSVAAAYLLEQCPAPPPALLSRETDCDGFAAAQNIACARLWGSSAASVRERMRHELDSLPERSRTYIDGAWDRLMRIVEVEPPLSLRELAPPVMPRDE